MGIRLRNERDFRARALILALDYLTMLADAKAEKAAAKCRASVDQSRVNLELAESKLAIHQEQCRTL